MKTTLLLALLALSIPTLAAEPVKFGDALYKKMQHDRCLQCHQFNSRKHNGRTYTSHRSRYLCDNCHTQRLTGLARGEWTAPAEDFDYTGMDARDTCLLIKRNLGAGDLKTRMTQHMLHDVRVRWGLENGMTPAGRLPTVPGGYAEWARDARAWIDDGMLCE